MLGVNARIGRTLTATENEPSAPAVAMLSNSYWQSRFAAGGDVIGKTILVNSVPVTIVGVAPPDFSGTQLVTANCRTFCCRSILRSIDSDRPRLTDATNWWVQLIGRRKPAFGPSRYAATSKACFRPGARGHGLASFFPLCGRARDDPQSESNRRAAILR